jgi:dipeptidyl aminopeptidase/acylaminoacyl peptidase
MSRLIFSLFGCLVLMSASSAGRAAERVLLYRIGPTQGTLYLSDADGSGEHALLPPGALDYDPAWSPKGDWIAFTSERNGSADLYRVHPDGTGLERLTDNPAYDDQAAFSPDGKQIVFVSTRAAGFANLWVQNIVTHKARLLTPGKGGDFRPSWSPDGKWIAFSTDRDSDLPNAKGRWERLHITGIALVHPDGTGFKRLTAKDGNACGSPKWTADSKSMIAYCMTGQATWDNRAGQGESDDSLQKIDIATGTATIMPAGAGVKAAPFALPSGEIGYLRRDKAENGVFYASGKAGPRAPISACHHGRRTVASWSMPASKQSQGWKRHRPGAAIPTSNFSSLAGYRRLTRPATASPPPSIWATTRQSCMLWRTPSRSARSWSAPN